MCKVSSNHSTNRRVKDPWKVERNKSIAKRMLEKSRAVCVSIQGHFTKPDIIPKFNVRQIPAETQKEFSQRWKWHFLILRLQIYFSFEITAQESNAASSAWTSRVSQSRAEKTSEPSELKLSCQKAKVIATQTRNNGRCSKSSFWLCQATFQR